MSKQIELCATVADELANTLEDHFLENELVNWGIMQREINDPYEVFGIFPDVEIANEALLKLRSSFPTLTVDFDEKAIADVDWKNAYKEFLKPWSDRHMHWVPLWERDTYKIPAGSAYVYLDSGMAFGTGSHETTRLCGRRLLDYQVAQESYVDQLQVVDAGCGSGILALSAAALGFKNVAGFDIDPEAIAVCNRNAAENSHTRTPDFTAVDLENGLRGKQSDLVIANIQTDILIPFRSHLVRSIKKSGTLVLSGILNKEIDQVRTLYIDEFERLFPANSVNIDSRQDGEWSDLQFQILL